MNTTHTTRRAFTKRDEFNQQLEAAKNGRKYYTVTITAQRPMRERLSRNKRDIEAFMKKAGVG